jgi:hypothetical protein
VSWVRLIAALGALLAAAGVGTAENSFMRGDYIAFLVTEFRSVETAPDKSYSMIRGVTRRMPQWDQGMDGELGPTSKV